MAIYFLWGDEDYLIERQINKLKKEILKDGVNEFSYKKVDNPSFSLFSELIRTNAMMFGDTLIQIKCPKYFLETKTKEKLDDKQVNELIEGLNNVSQNIHLILVCPTPKGEKKKPDSRKKLFKEIQKLAQIQEFQSFRSYEEYKIIPHIKKMAGELSLKTGDKEASYLIQTTGTQLRDLAMQLDKIKLLIHPRDIVKIEDIKEIASSNADIFNLVDLIIEKKYDKALCLISDILQKEHFLPSLAFIQTTFSNLLKIKLYSKTLSPRELSFKLNQSEFIIKKNLEKLKNIKEEELIRLKINLSQAEYYLKSGALKDPISAYELAFLEDNLC